MDNFEIHIQEFEDKKNIKIITSLNIEELNECLNDMLQHVGGIEFKPSGSLEELNYSINNLITDNPITKNIKTLFNSSENKEIQITNIKIIKGSF